MSATSNDNGNEEEEEARLYEHDHTITMDAEAISYKATPSFAQINSLPTLEACLVKSILARASYGGTRIVSILLLF